jgi:hypothetical protein
LTTDRPTEPRAVAFNMEHTPLAEGVSVFSLPDSLAEPLREVFDDEPVAIHVGVRSPVLFGSQLIGYSPATPLVCIADMHNVAILYAQLTRIAEHGPEAFRAGWPDALRQATEAIRDDPMTAGDMQAEAEEAARKFTESEAGRHAEESSGPQDRAACSHPNHPNFPDDCRFPKHSPKHSPSEPCDCTDPRIAQGDSPRPYHCAAFGSAER